MELNELGVIAKKIKQFEKKGIYTAEDLINTYPRKYIDYRNPFTLNQAESGKKCSMILIVREAKKKELGKMGVCVDLICREIETRNPVTIRWIGQEYMYETVNNLYNMTVAVCGTFTHNDKWGDFFNNPDLFSTDVQSVLKLLPVYSSVQGMSSEYYKKTLENAISLYKGEEKYSVETRKYFSVITEKDMITKIHNPRDARDIQQGNKRLVFDALYQYASKVVKDTQIIQKKSDFKPVKLVNFKKVIDAFPYELTEDQKKAVLSFVNKANEGNRVNALVQGDVGSGKTVCAFLMMVAMADNGYQSVLMAPTGVLAKQHYNELKGYVEPLGLEVVYLSGELKAKEKKEIYAKIKSGEASLIVGTHSVISDGVEFNNLGLTIVDEEHRFGVVQRENLRKKADEGVHSVTMSATPIPRTLGMALYENAMDIYSIESMPNGRKPVKTAVVKDDASIFRFMESEIIKGHQCYIVCPLIGNEDVIEDEDSNAPESVENVYEKVNNYFSIRGNIKAGIVTGKMKDEEKTEIITSFKNNEIQILIATTIIEVGVNVPNATVITVMNADRFGLATLHQLRGRVGRSSLQSYCMLKSDDLHNDRLQIMCNSNNGFEIAESDLKLRGAGEFLGTKQSGDDKNIKLILKYPDFYKEIKKYVQQNNGKGE